MPRQRKKKDELTVALEAAKASGKFMVAIWRVQDDKLELFRVTEGFPLADVPTALGMLKDDMAPLTIQKEEVTPEAK